MIITVNELLNSGFSISDEISNEKLEKAIDTAELFIVKPRLTDKKYIDIISDPTDYAVVIEGGIATKEDGEQVYLAGLKRSMCHLAYAILLRENINATSFGTVLKKDDYSDQASEERILKVGMQAGEIGLQYLKEVTDYLNIKNNDKHLQNAYFSEYL